MILKLNKNIPKQRDIIIIDFDPQKGVEIQKRRPALVISDNAFQKHTGLVFVAPITSTLREKFPLHVNIPNGSITGDILCEQVKSLDFNARQWKKVETLDPILFEEVKQILAKILTF